MQKKFLRTVTILSLGVFGLLIQGHASAMQNDQVRLQKLKNMMKICTTPVYKDPNNIRIGQLQQNHQLQNCNQTLEIKNKCKMCQNRKREIDDLEN